MPLNRLLSLCAAAWLGLLMAVAFLAAPSAFKVLDRSAAGALVGRLFALEAPLSLGTALLCAVLSWYGPRAAALHGDGLVHRSRDERLWLAMAAALLTVLGYYALQPAMAAARAGTGSWSFGQLHALSLGAYALKLAVVGVLAWRCTRAPASAA